MSDPAVFLDRDGTLIEEVGFASRPEQIRILGGVAQALSELADAGYRLIVVTNQSGIARGYMTEEDLERFHDALDQQLHLLGAAVDAYYACPHHPQPGAMARPDLAVECDCRKPRPGLILRAAEDFRIDLKASWTVGDTWRDIAAGQAAGTRTIKLPADAAHRAPRPVGVDPPTAEVRGLAEAARVILGREQPSLAETAAATTEDEDEGLAAAEEPPPTPAALAADTFPDETHAADIEAQSDAAEEELQAEAPEPEPIITEAEAQEVAETEEDTEPETTGDTLAPSLSRQGRGGNDSPAPAAEDAADETHCARCGRDIAAADIVRGEAVERDGFLLCPECLAEQPREPGAGPDASTEDLLRLVLAELQRMRRAQRPSSLSLFRLLAYIVQAGALFFGFGLAVVGDEPDLYLRVALLLQLLVLALLLFERRS
ncbi:MAG: HAD family hydrolase [Phycisphaerae bacterium]